MATKCLLVVSLCTALLSVAACRAEAADKALVVYFSLSGNTRALAEEIQKQSGADIFEIKAVKPYNGSYNETINLAKKEQADKARPVIAGKVESLADYSVVFVGFPNWWGDMPMILYTFFDEYDLAGKTIAPFCTSGGSGLSDTVNAIKGLEPGAAVVAGLHVGGSRASSASKEVSDWLGRIGLAK